MVAEAVGFPVEEDDDDDSVLGVTAAAAAVDDVFRSFSFLLLLEVSAVESVEDLEATRVSLNAPLFDVAGVVES